MSSSNIFSAGFICFTSCSDGGYTVKPGFGTGPLPVSAVTSLVGLVVLLLVVEETIIVVVLVVVVVLTVVISG